MKEILGYEMDEVAAVLQMCPRTIERCVESVKLRYSQSEHNWKTHKQFGHDF